MRTISRTSQFKKDYKRESKGQYRLGLDDALRAVLALLATDAPLPERYRDHPLSGDYRAHRECHLKPDLLLIYMKQGETNQGEMKQGGSAPEEASLRLVRLGSHSELF